MKTFFMKFASLPVKTRVIMLLCFVLILAIIFPIICSSVGASMGNVVGLAVGSYKVVTEAVPEGYANGKDDGLSAEDTTSRIVSYTRGIGKLEVLVAGVKLSNFHQVGDKYAALYLVKGDATFTVDLSEATITFSPDYTDVVILLPELEVSLAIDDTSTEQVAEWQTKFFNGSTSDGIEAYINSRLTMQQNVSESIANYDELMESAKESAITQIRSLVSGICGNNVTINISFR